MRTGIQLDVLTALACAEKPLSSRCLLAYCPSAETATDVCRALYEIRKAGYIEERGEPIPSESKMGKPLRTYAITEAGRRQLAGAEAKPAEAAIVLVPGGSKSANVVDSAPPVTVPEAHVCCGRCEPAAAPEAPAQDQVDPVLQAIGYLERPAPLLYQSDIHRLQALADRPLCAGTVGAWLRDLARRIGQEVQS